MGSTAYLSLGSNIDARRNITSCIETLRAEFSSVSLSPVYRAAAWGFDGADFINLVACVETGMQPLELKQYLHALEDRHQRRRNVPKFSDRTLDIDILLYDDLYLLSPELEIPRNEILEAVHVLKPLADLAPDLVHPACKKTIAELWRNFPGDHGELKQLEL